jgi:predicted dienelactone hydrolase
LATAAAVAVAVVAAGACAGGTSDKDSSTSTSASASSRTLRAARTAAPYDVTTLQRSYVDSTRPTNDPEGTRSAPSRTLATTIRVPEGKGPFPLVVFAHGNRGHPRKVTQLLDAWARQGYVVVAPAFPLTNNDVVGNTVITDYLPQAGDVSFLITQVLDESRSGTGPLAGTVDGEHIAVAGHSLGGATAYAVAANACCRDARVDALMVLSGIRLDPEQSYVPTDQLPLLALHGTGDGTLPVDIGRKAYATWTGPKWFVSLDGATHASPYENDPSPYDDVVIDVTTRFLDAMLHGTAPDRAAFGSYAPPPGLARIESTP